MRPPHDKSHLLINPLQNISIVLVRPQYAGNIGSVCRAMKNMGLSRLVLVAPEQDPLSLEGRKMATSARDILERAEVFPSLEAALEGFRWIAGTSARQGTNRGPFISPREISGEIIDHARSIPVAILFGPEDRGLTNEELAPCEALISIPTHGLSSLNLSHAVMILAYELFLSSQMRDHRLPSLSGEAGPESPPFPPPPRGRVRVGGNLAEFQKLEKMYAHLEELLSRIGFLNPQNPKRIMHTLRRIFGRARLSDRDVAVLRGIFRQLDWYAAHYSEKGMQKKGKETKEIT